eukprot:TRINITY_DN775862_c0_g1_i1.p1 TRINITY_DN775862_c0_g1~~TRINITY_DN775862_c0_g1_i1.p1  ORF type:complete len:402 (-),score=88.38 TRINITY_DN775862_c0_g1_i1:116-1321(-)
MKVLLLLLFFAIFSEICVAECPNECNGHGICGRNDRCFCYDQYTGNDCSLRVCPSSRAFDKITTHKSEVLSPHYGCESIDPLICSGEGLVLDDLTYYTGTSDASFMISISQATTVVHIPFIVDTTNKEMHCTVSNCFKEIKVGNQVQTRDGFDFIISGKVSQNKMYYTTGVSLPNVDGIEDEIVTIIPTGGATVKYKKFNTRNNHSFEDLGGITTVAMALDEGISIQFTGNGQDYKKGDYWVIHAIAMNVFDFDSNDVNTMHQYTECGGQGICDSLTGLCNCFEGYSGEACQRMNCPNNCNGHGVCQSAEYFAVEAGSSYSVAYDSRKINGCKCDIGFRGPDCSLIECPSSNDPLLSDFDDGKQLFGLDCSGRGLCDYTSGVCACFRGYTGEACEEQKNVY